MNRFWKLLNWEIGRFGKYYAVLWLVVLLSQFTGVIVYSDSFMKRVHDTVDYQSTSIAEYAAQSGTISFVDFTKTLWFSAPIALCSATLLLYVFLIWYREWFGKSNFMYRLLMLPTARMNVYLAKLSAILLFVLGLVAFQLLILVPEISLFHSMIPIELRDDMSIVELIRGASILSLLIPRYFIEFVLIYGAGLMVVIVIFTAILLERSFKIIGIAAGILYGVAAGFVFFLPILFAEKWNSDFFYPSELLRMEIGVGILIICCSLWFSSYLLRKKVTV